MDTADSKLARASIVVATYAWMPLFVLGTILAVDYLMFGDLKYQYLALWCIVPFVPSFVGWYRHVWRPWTARVHGHEARARTQP